MVSNEKVIESFLNQDTDYIQNRSVRVSRNKLFSYSTCIAQFGNINKNRLYINRTRYSNTTSKHLFTLKRLIEKYHKELDVIYVEDVPIDTIDICKFLL